MKYYFPVWLFLWPVLTVLPGSAEVPDVWREKPVAEVTRSAEVGNPDAMAALGMMYWKAGRRPKIRPKAFPGRCRLRKRGMPNP